MGNFVENLNLGNRVRPPWYKSRITSSNQKNMVILYFTLPDLNKLYISVYR